MTNCQLPSCSIWQPGRPGCVIATLFLLASLLAFPGRQALGADPGPPADTGEVVSDQKPGSVLFFNVYTSDATDIDYHNTKFAVTNTASSLDVSIQVFFIDGLSGGTASFGFCLTRNQTISFQAVDLDPNTEGYVVVVAVDSNGMPIVHNHLVGDMYIKFGSGHHAGLGAIGVSARTVPTVRPADSQVDLEFNGTSYDRLPLTIAVDNIPSRINNNDTLLFINRAGGNLITGVAEIGSLFGLLYNDAEFAHSFNVYSPRCQIKLGLNINNPRTTPLFTTVIPDGRSGWMRIYSVQGQATIGAVLNFNSGTAGVPGAFSGGRNLHFLTSTSATITMPIVPNNCSIP